MLFRRWLALNLQLLSLSFLFPASFLLALAESLEEPDESPAVVEAERVLRGVS